MSLNWIKSDTTSYAVIGDPIKQSRSPIMMNRAFAKTGINAAYLAFHVEPSRLQAAIEGMKALQFGGLNVTIPHKLDVMNYIDEIDDSARIIGAVNTIVNENGHWIGYNTDGIGYVRSLIEETGMSIAGANIVVIGAGGAARGIVYALSQHAPASITIANRTADKAKLLAESLSAYGQMDGVGLEDIYSLTARIDLVINTTSVGMFPQTEAMPIKPEWLEPHMTVSDLIYNPMKTALLSEAERKGCTIHGGLGMFIYQGAYAFEYWTGQTAPVAEMREVVLQSLT